MEPFLNGVGRHGRGSQSGSMIQADLSTKWSIRSMIQSDPMAKLGSRAWIPLDIDFLQMSRCNIDCRLPLFARLRRFRDPGEAAVFNPAPHWDSRFSTTYWGGGYLTPPSILAPIGRREKRKKRSKAHQKWLRNCFRQFFAYVKIVVSSFSRLSNIVSENLHYLGNY